MKRHRVVALVVAASVGGCVDVAQDPDPPQEFQGVTETGAYCLAQDEVEDARISERALHNRVECAIWSLGVDAVYPETFGYGNWCGSGNFGPAPPVNCWDDACRRHDLDYGREIDGWRNCHSLDLVWGWDPDTVCIQRADEALCEGWFQCDIDRAEARASWSWWGWSRRCVADPERQPERCRWLEHVGLRTPVYSCLPCPVADPRLPDISPGPGCAVPVWSSEEETISTCCDHYAEGERPTACDCYD